MAEITRLRTVRRRHMRPPQLAQLAQLARSVPAPASPKPPPSTAQHLGGASAPYMVPVLELLTPGFVLRYTHYRDLQTLLWAGGLDPQALLGLSESPNANWDAYIARSSPFSNWSELLRQARGEWLVRRLGLVVDRD